MKWKRIVTPMILAFMSIVSGALAFAQENGWIATYYANETLSGIPVVTQIEVSPNHDWQFNAPAFGIPEDHWSARWSSSQNLVPGARYRLSIAADDGVRVFINGVLVINEWHGFVSQTYTHEFTAYGSTQITIEMFDTVRQAYLKYSLEQVTSTPLASPTVENATRPSATVNVALLNVRSAPDINSPIWTQIRQGETYTVRRGSITGWLQLIINGEVGWVTNQFVNLHNTQYLVNLAGTSEIRVRVARLNVRNRPWLSGSSVVAKINRDEQHYIVGQSADTKWLLIDVNGSFGWVNRDYVDVKADIALPVVNEVPPQIPPAREYILVTVTPYTINLRTGPGLFYADIGNLPPGTEARVLGRTEDNNWWQIDYNGNRGWVAAAYAHIQENAVIDAIPIISIS